PPLFQTVRVCLLMSGRDRPHPYNTRFSSIVHPQPILPGLGVRNLPLATVPSAPDGSLGSVGSAATDSSTAPIVVVDPVHSLQPQPSSLSTSHPSFARPLPSNFIPRSSSPCSRFFRPRPAFDMSNGQNGAGIPAGSGGGAVGSHHDQDGNDHHAAGGNHYGPGQGGNAGGNGRGREEEQKGPLCTTTQEELLTDPDF